MVGDAHLADVVQRRRLEQQFDILVRQKIAETRQAAHLLRQRLQVMRGAADMVARLAVARLGQRGHGVDGDVLQRRHFLHAALHFRFQVLVLVAQEILHLLHRQLRPDARQHDGRRDRLGDVVDGAQGQAQLLVRHFAHGRDENHGDAGRGGIGLQRAAHVVAAHARHHDIEQDQVGLVAAGGDLQGALAIDGDLGAVLAFQHRAQQVDIVRRVIHHQDGGLAIQGFHALPSLFISVLVTVSAPAHRPPRPAAPAHLRNRIVPACASTGAHVPPAPPPPARGRCHRGA
ncbi:hypothetical protein D3C72_937770 [compost metagenome]